MARHRCGGELDLMYEPVAVLKPWKQYWANSVYKSGKREDEWDLAYYEYIHGLDHKLACSTTLIINLASIKVRLAPKGEESPHA